MVTRPLHVNEAPATGTHWHYRDSGGHHEHDITIEGHDSRFVIGILDAPNSGRIYIAREDWERGATPLDNPPRGDDPDRHTAIVWPPPPPPYSTDSRATMNEAIIALAARYKPQLSQNDGVRLLAHLADTLSKNETIARVLAAALREQFIEGVTTAIDNAAMRAYDMGRDDIRWEINHIVSPPRGPIDEPRPVTPDLHADFAAKAIARIGELREAEILARGAALERAAIVGAMDACDPRELPAAGDPGFAFARELIERRK